MIQLSKKQFLKAANNEWNYAYEYEFPGIDDYGYLCEDNMVRRGYYYYVVASCYHHGDWLCNVHEHLNGIGCPNCNSNRKQYCKSSTNKTKNHQSILYYFLDEISNLYKIGITSQTFKNRFPNKLLKDIKLIETWDFDSFEEARDEESRLHKLYYKHRVFNPRFANNGGTEFFKKDILGLDV